MVRRFRGEGVQKVDGKGRVSIPADFRVVLRDGDPNWSEGKLPEFVIVYGDAHRDYLECFTVEAAQEVDDQISRLKRGSPARRALEKLFNGQSISATVDDTGRIVLPQKLRQKIGIEAEAYFIAMGDTFQIWKPETHEAADAAIDQVIGDLPPGADLWTLLEVASEEGA